MLDITLIFQYSNCQNSSPYIPTVLLLFQLFIVFHLLFLWNSPSHLMSARLRIFLFLITAPFVLLAHLHPSSFFCLSLSPSCYILLDSPLSPFFFLQIISWLIFYIIFLSKQQVDGWPCAWVMVLLRIRLGHTVQIISFLDAAHEVFFLIFFLFITPIFCCSSSFFSSSLFSCFFFFWRVHTAV